MAFYTKQDFLFHIDRYHFDGPSSSESKEPRFRLLQIETNAMIYIHPKFSNELGFWHKQANRTEISLLRSLVASQQKGSLQYNITGCWSFLTGLDNSNKLKILRIPTHTRRTSWRFIRLTKELPN